MTPNPQLHKIPVHKRCGVEGSLTGLFNYSKASETGTTAHKK